MAYVDTSVLLALFLNEAKTADAWSWLDRQASDATTVSDWTLTEISSALSVKRRMSMLDDQTYIDVLSKVRDFAKSQLAIITLDHADFQRAAALCDQWQLGLRAGDALHLAIAERRNLTVCTLDRIMRGTAVSLGMPVETP
jgi:hypothetical protein